MRFQKAGIIVLFALLSLTNSAMGDSTSTFSGPYLGIDVGTISYNTQITFDGVDDPAGRGGAGYGFYSGWNFARKNWLVGAEGILNWASVPNPYTFDPAVTGFSELDLRRGVSIGIDIRGGYVAIERILFYGSVGYSINKQSVRIDDTPLEQFEGGASAKTYGAFQFGAGLEFKIASRLIIRSTFRTFSGYDLDASGFGVLPINASLMRFDVEPSQQQFMFGLAYSF